MAAIKDTRSKEVTSKRKLIRQEQYRRKTNLMEKGMRIEYSRMCSVDVRVGIRTRETGQVHISGYFGIWG